MTTPAITPLVDALTPRPVPAKPGLNSLVDKIRAAHPGAYDDMDDAQLTNAVLAKYPQYSDLAVPAVPKPNVPMRGVPENFGEKIGANLAEAYPHVKPIAQSAANDVYDVSTPNIATQIYRKIKGLPNTLHDLPEKMVVAWLTSGGLPEGEIAPPTPENPIPRLRNIPEPTTPLDRLRNQAVPPAQPDYVPERPSIERLGNYTLAKTTPESLAENKQALREALGKLSPETPKTPSSNKIITNGDTYEYKSGQFFKNGTVLESGDEIADAVHALEGQPGKVIEGEWKPSSPQLQAPAETSTLEERLLANMKRIKANQARAATRAAKKAAQAAPQDLSPDLQEMLRRIQAGGKLSDMSGR